MQLKFKNQHYQEDASRAVADVFAGQPNQAPTVYLRDLGKAASSKGMESMFENADLELPDGYGNAAVRLSAAELLSNVQTVQRANSITPSASLAPGQGAVNLDVEWRLAPARPTCTRRRCSSSTAATVGRSSSSWYPAWPSARAL